MPIDSGPRTRPVKVGPYSIRLTDAEWDGMVQRAILAASVGVEGCDTGMGGCGGTHTDCYYSGILAAALASASNDRYEKGE